jgi:membrane protein YqaA with SNARE-associated domain
MSWEIWSVFAAAFISATILPGGSEVVLIAAIGLGNVDWVTLVAVATLGNTLGSSTNWVIGRIYAEYKDDPRLPKFLRSPISPEKYEKYAAWYAKWGVWTLAASWVPLIGDALTIVSGIMKAPFWLSMIIIAFAKGTRYVLVAVATVYGIHFFGL